MENETEKILDGMELNAPPLVYLHEHFKEYNTDPVTKKTFLPNNWVWYSKEDLKAICAMVKAIKGDGVRLYYGMYNDKVCEFLHKKNPSADYSEYEGRNTVFFVPTTKGASANQHIDSISTETVKEYREKYMKNADLDQKAFADGYNVGHICPPYIKGETDCTKSGSNL